MKNLKTFIKKSQIQSYQWIIIILMLVGYQCNAQKIYNNEELFDKGFKAYLDDNYIEAAIFLFAYVQKKPDRMRTNQKHKNQVNEALAYARGDRFYGDALTKGDQAAKPKPQLNKPTKSNSIVYKGNVKLKGIYTIQQKKNGQFVDAHEGVNDNSMVTRNKQNNETQQWVFKQMGRNTFTIRQKSNGRYVDAHEDSNDNSIVTRKRQNNNSQLWVLTLVGIRTYTIQQKSNGRYVDSHEGVNDNSMVTRNKQNNDTQKWIIRKRI